MIRLQAYKFELVVDGQQRRQLASAVGSCRFVFNKALAHQTELYKQNPKTKFSYSELTSLLPLWKKEFPWLSDAPSQSLQQALKDLEKAYKNFFAKRAKFPRFKKRGIKNSFRLPQGVKLKQDDALVFLPKMGWVRYRKSQNILGELKNTTISEHAGRWYISFQTERDVHDPIPFAQQEAVGIDMGIARFLTLSDGQYIAPKNSFRKHEVRLKRYQKSFSRKCKGSKNWKKAKQRVQKMHARIANIRKDFIHQASNAIASSFKLVVMEDLQTKNMSKSAAGTKENPGKNVKAKSGLNKAILDQGWFEFRRQLGYKLAWRGGELRLVNPKNTSRKCPECGHICAENRKTQAVFCCVGCGFEGHADHVGAINVLAAGLHASACGEDIRLLSSFGDLRAAFVKQEYIEGFFDG